MRNPERIDEFLYKLGECWKLVPDWRFGQLIVNILRNSRIPDPFYIEDEKFLKMVNEYFDDEK